MKKIISLIYLSVLLSLSIHSQSIHYDYEDRHILRLEANKIFFDLDDSFGNFVNYFNGHFKIGDQTYIQVELPISITDNFFNDSDVAIGNIGIGLGYKNFEVNIYAPTVSNNFASELGAIYNVSEKFGLFIDVDGIVAIKSYANIALLKPPAKNSGFNVKFRPGTTIIIPTEDGRDPELLFDLGIRGGFRSTQINTYLALTNTIIITEDDLDFDDRLFTDLAGYIGHQFNHIEIGLVTRVPIDKLIQDIINVSVGFSIKYSPFKVEQDNGSKEVGFVF